MARFSNTTAQRLWLMLISSSIHSFRKKSEISTGAWFATSTLCIPCSSWSAFSRLWHGARTREHRLGDGAREKERKGFLQLFQLLRLIHVQNRAGGLWPVEQLASSLLFEVPEVKQLSDLANVSIVYFDQCCYYLRPPGREEIVGQRVKKQYVAV